MAFIVELIDVGIDNFYYFCTFFELRMTRKVCIIALSAVIFMSLNCFAQNKQQSKETLDYIDKYKDIAMTEMVKNKIPASITLAQGILESGNGRSVLATKGNNHFGIKCHDDWKGRTMRVDDDAPKECFRVYDKAEDSYRDHSQFLKRDRYKDLFCLKITDYEGWAKGLKKAGYATLPTYASVLIKLIENYELYNYDEMVVSGKFKVKGQQSNGGQQTKVDEQQTTVGGQHSMDKDKQKNENPRKKERKEKRIKKRIARQSDVIPVLAECAVVGITDGNHYIRENFGVKFIYTKENDSLQNLAAELGVYKYQLVKYNDLGNKKTFKDGEVLYIEPKRLRAADCHKYHIIQKGETLSLLSRLYAVQLDRLFKMNDLDENSVLSVGQIIRLR